MRQLMFSIYNGGNVGLFNNLMSLELAVGLGVLCDRTLVLQKPQHPIFNSETKKTVFDLFDLRVPYLFADTKAGHEVPVLPDLHARRLHRDDWERFESAPILSTQNDHTLGYYSYTLPFDERVVLACHNALTPKPPYVLEALGIVGDLVRNYGRFASIHIRRKDFARVYKRARHIVVDEMLHCITCHVPKECLLVIHSDETDHGYFAPILAKYRNAWIIDETLFRCHHKHTFDSAELGLISAIVASHSDIFVGTMFSTFTGHIQRKRILNGKRAEFLYLYNQRPGEVGFKDGRIPEEGHSEFTWERIKMSAQLRAMCFWWREWPEAVAGPCLPVEPPE